MTVSGFEEITKKKPEKSLVVPLKRTGGRNAQGRITTRHIGGRHKRMYRLIDFKRDKDNMPAAVLGIEYDPNRSARIALLRYEDGEKRYILCPVDLKINDRISSGAEVEVKPGNCLPLRNIPLGTLIHNVELTRGNGGQIVRSAGTSAQLMAKEGDYAHVKLPSGEIRLIHLDCRGTIGQLGNPEHNTISIGKAGRSRWLGRRPNVRGVAMNPHDHPMGGGEGKSKGGEPSQSPWGWQTKGFRTRPKRKYSDKYIVKRRG